MSIKKILLSFIFVAVFGIYIVYQQGNSNNSNVPILVDNKQSQVQPKPKTATQTTSGLKDGQYTGISADAFYGRVQVKAIIKGGKITDIQFLNYPQDRQHSAELSNYSLPILKTEAIQSQSGNVDIVSGATATSQAFMQSLASALSQA